MQKLKQYLGELMIIVGSGISIFNLLSWSYTGEFSKGLLPDLPSFKGELLSGVAYYYTIDHIILITLGVIFIIMGTLIVRNKK